MNARRGAFCVGITGHRSIDAPEDALRGAVRAARDRIVARVAPRTVAIISALAEGVDRWVAETWLELPEVQLVAVLPMPKVAYADDFPASLEAFEALLARARERIELPPAESRIAGYAAVGRWIVAESDLLMAVWNGEPARGPGGTGEVVANARALGKPLAWIRPDGVITYERLDEE